MLLFFLLFFPSFFFLLFFLLLLFFSFLGYWDTAPSGKYLNIKILNTLTFYVLNQHFVANNILYGAAFFDNFSYFIFYKFGCITIDMYALTYVSYVCVRTHTVAVEYTPSDDDEESRLLSNTGTYVNTFVST